MRMIHNEATFGTGANFGGFRLLYHEGQTNHCPACSGTHWMIGRATAQCVRCDTALPLAMMPGQSNLPTHMGEA